MADIKNQWPLQRDCISFYGDPSRAGWLHANTVDVPCPWQLYVESTPVSHILIHKKCADSLTRVLHAVWDAVGQSNDEIRKLHYHRFDGSYNYRPMRGGHSMSMHSFAAAIDWDAAENPFHSRKFFFTENSPLIVKFKEEGWVWGGDWSPGSQDAMHIQAARVHP